MTPQQQAQIWLAQQGITTAKLSSLYGYTNHVFLVESAQAPKRSVIRIANHDLASGLCPLAQHPKHVIKLHQDAVDLGLAPALLSFDDQVGIMWLNYAGEPRALQASDFPEVRALLQRLHASDLAWRSPDQTDLDVASLQHLQRLANAKHPEVKQTAQRLLSLAAQRGYGDYPLKPVHSDLNPNNWLHDGSRWWLIDWDYARLMVAEWDYASLMVENGWDKTQAQVLMPLIPLADLAWFCAAFALLSWDWHVQRGTEQIEQKQAITAYWFKYCLS
jgi:thiamine kinase-like enzyme